MFIHPEHCHLLAMNLRNKKEKHLHIGVNVKIPELIYSFFFFPLTSMPFDPDQPSQKCWREAECGSEAVRGGGSVWLGVMTGQGAQVVFIC